MAYYLIPFLSSLFKSIEWLVQLDAIFLWVRFFIARRLLHEYLLVFVELPI